MLKPFVKKETNNASVNQRSHHLTVYLLADTTHENAMLASPNRLFTR
jgi:hypothetical protein